MSKKTSKKFAQTSSKKHKKRSKSSFRSTLLATERTMDKNESSSEKISEVKDPSSVVMPNVTNLQSTLSFDSLPKELINIGLISVFLILLLVVLSFIIS